MKAFKQMHPQQGYEELSEKVVDYAGGVPLALIVLGSHLHKRLLHEWELQLNKLTQSPEPSIQRILKISYDGLEEDLLKDIFLEVACLFKGYPVNYVSDIVDGWGIIRLIEKCLITIRDNTLEMHDLIQEMARDIARKRGIFLWNHEDIYHLLTKNTRNEAVEGVLLDMCKVENIPISSTALDMSHLMPNLRLLKFYRHLFGQKKQDPVFTVESSQSNNLLQLPHRLRLLHWEEYPFESLPLKFSMQNLVDLTLTDSSIIQFWDGKGPENLKRLDLSHSVQLGRLPDLSSAKKMEKICLEDCQSLVEIPYSIQCLHNLTDLFLRWCTNLRSIPNMAMLISLKRLNLSYCSNLKMLPEVPKDIEWIELEQSGVEEWSSIPVWEKVAALNMKNCKNLASLPSLVHLKSLGILNLSGCSNLTMLPEIPNCIKRLELQMSGIVEWSPCIGTLENLRFLDMRFCKNMRSFPSLIHSKSLHTIYLHGCINLTILPEVPSSVKFLELENSGLKELKGFCNLSKFPDFTANREKLILDELAIQELPSSIRCFSSSLNALSMHRCKSLEILPDSICELKCLRSLDLSDCLKLAKLPPLNGLNSLEILDLNKSAIVEIPAELPSSLVELRMECCRNVKILPDSICELKCLQILNLKGCLILEKLPPLDGLNSLEKLNLTETAIVEIPAELPSSLVELSMEHCRNLKILPNSICELKCLPILNLNGCLRLEKLPPLDGLNSLEKLNLNDTAIVEIPAELPPSLVDLSMEHCRNVKFLPNSICELKCLKGLILNGCLILEKLPPLDGLNSLEMLDLTSCAIEEIPTELPPSLRMMRLEYCRFLRILPVSIFGLKKLQLCIKGCSKLFKLLPLDALKALLYRAVSGKEEIIKEISIKSQLSYRVSAVVRKQLEWLNKH